MIGCALALIALAGCKDSRAIDGRADLASGIRRDGNERRYVRETAVVGCLFPRYLIARLCGCGFTQ